MKKGAAPKEPPLSCVLSKRLLSSATQRADRVLRHVDQRLALFRRQYSAADQPLDLIDERLDLVDGWADLAVVQIGRRNVEPVEQGVALALIFGRQGFSRQGSRRRGGTFVLRLTEGIRSISEIDALKTSLKGKTVEVDVVTATTP